MLSWLRTPMAFSLLTAVVIGWLGAWRLASYPYPSFDYETQTAQYRPFYLLSKGRTSPAVPHFVGCCIELGLTIEYAVQTTSRVGYITHNYLGSEPDKYMGEPIIAAADVHIQTTLDEIGILAPIATRRLRTFEFSRVGSHPKMSSQAAFNAYCGAAAPDTHPFPQAAIVSWGFSPLAAVHDALFLPTFLSWLSSLAAIPGWPIWRRLTPAQRRRARGACPRCGYSLAGLASPVCPECGKDLAKAPHGVPY